jgi:hypothetical protein
MKLIQKNKKVTIYGNISEPIYIEEGGTLHWYSYDEKIGYDDVNEYSYNESIIINYGVLFFYAPGCFMVNKENASIINFGKMDVQGDPVFFTNERNATFYNYGEFQMTFGDIYNDGLFVNQHKGKMDLNCTWMHNNAEGTMFNYGHILSSPETCNNTCFINGKDTLINSGRIKNKTLKINKHRCK